jgi:branched-subunit amino acid transport protein
MDDGTLILALLLAIAATYVWRLGGLLISGRLDADGAVFRWFYCVAYALLAGLISRMVVLPGGVLIETHLIDRLIALAIAVAVFFLLRRNFLAATFTGAATFVALIAVRGSW